MSSNEIERKVNFSNFEKDLNNLIKQYKLIDESKNSSNDLAKFIMRSIRNYILYNSKTEMEQAQMQITNRWLCM